MGLGAWLVTSVAYEFRRLGDSKPQKGNQAKLFRHKDDSSNADNFSDFNACKAQNLEKEIMPSFQCPHRCVDLGLHIRLQLKEHKSMSWCGANVKLLKIEHENMFKSQHI